MRNEKGQYLKGNVPDNPIQKGERRGKATEFKKGITPSNKVPVGTTTIRQHRFDKPRAWIKIAEPNTWMRRSEYVWLSIAGPIPKGFLIHHINKDTMDDRIENLACMIRGGHVNRHRLQLIEARKTIEIPIRKIQCMKCGDSFDGKHQQKRSQCPKCRKEVRSEKQRRYKQWIRTQNRQDRQAAST